ncbi:MULTISPECIES: antiterminator Q family protein [unclassified Arsenophonus]|uniref:antiterminator Q family protein n=2 Tax=Arsenophonus TaxID=637 RepID=UPI00285A7A6B|nr:antiterminator Q family protein [Arsenophonus sp.]MDR5615387.1 antiterminator Q family protein [Arsenophonus sp.]
MSRDIEKILLHWGGWCAGNPYAAVSWLPVASGFDRFMPFTGANRLSCSDADGLVIDVCVSRLNTVGMARELNYIEDYYIRGISKRAIARKFAVREDEVRKRMQIAEGFILGCLETLDIQLDIDVLYKYHTNSYQTLVRPQKVC